MTVYASGGMKVFIGGVKNQKSEDFILADFNAEVWTEIKEVEAAGSAGDTSEAINFTALGDKRTRTIKGPRSAGTMEIVCGIDPSDAGQLAVVAAEKTNSDYAFKLVFNDAPAGGSPSERYFIAKVMSQSEQFDQASSVMKINIGLGINSNIVRVSAAA
ncbi:MAG: hypothetical protein LCH47_11125 [Proteobacteria bacterium]|nr:hypothetical protein [Pseudomonadota bacterium]